MRKEAKGGKKEEVEGGKSVIGQLVLQPDEQALRAANKILTAGRLLC